EGHWVNLIDTPGRGDFLGHAIACFPAVETVVVMIDAARGIDTTVRRLMKVAEQRNLPRMIIINGIDHPEADCAALLEQVRAAFGNECLPIGLPAKGGSRVINVFEHDGSDAEGDDADFSSVSEAHQMIVEQIVEMQDDLMNTYLEKGEEGLDPKKLHDAEGSLARMRNGEPHVLRLRTPAETIVVHDDVLGEVSFDADHIDDFIIRKRDGFPTYHFAVVVDDELMGVTHVMRGQEHLNNTPRHVALQRALDFHTPAYAHLPLIFNPDGSKMSKRDKDKAARVAGRDAKLDAPPVPEIDEATFAKWLKDKSTQLPQSQLVALAQHLELSLPEIDVEDFRSAGYLPSTVCNYLALLGWNPGVKNDDGTDLERFDMAYLAEHFSPSRLGKTASKFDRAKLAAFSGDDLQTMDPAKFEAEWRTWAERSRPDLIEALGERVPLACRAAQIRVQTLADVETVIHFALIDDDAIEYDAKAVGKVLTKNDGAGVAMLRDLEPVLAGVEPWEPGAIESSIKAFCEQREVGMGKAAQPLRIAMTGGTVSPGLGDTIGLLPRERAIARIA
ncbi:MAG: glutamate--tRNA ligase family protein, partial [Planctomycetota bacterium]